MPATVTTEEQFPSSATPAQLDKEVALRIKAGAIESSYAQNTDGSWTLTTKWNVIGEQ